MKTIQPFIDAGWYTVPLSGELKRIGEDGDKTIPVFEKNWRDKYSKVFNQRASKLGGAMTGKNSNIIAIDCDNTLTFNMFKALDPDYECVFMSQGKGDKVCGTFIYQYDESLDENFSINDNTIALDFYSNNGFVYLPTEANETKVAWNGTLHEPKVAPETTIIMLQQMRLAQEAKKTERVVERAASVITANCLQPLVAQFLERKHEPLIGLFRVITPKDFRDLPQYLKHGYLSPEFVPNGRGSEYLSKVSAILGADVSIDTDTYVSTMHAINSLFSDPMPNKRLEKTVLDPMLNGNASIDGVAIWRYDENWKDYRLLLSSKCQSTVEAFFDPNQSAYYLHDMGNDKLFRFARDGELFAYIEAYCVRPPKRAALKNSIHPAEVVKDPSKEFGTIESDNPTLRRFNAFRQTYYLKVLNNPEVHKMQYRKPEITLDYLASLVPNPIMREYLLGFLKRKLTKFEYSPVILMFLGVQGSGKDTLVNMLEEILGGEVARPSVDEFMEKHNAWITNCYFAQLDDYGEQVTNASERSKLSGKLKQYSGKPSVQVRAMHRDGELASHSATFIMSANSNPLLLEDGDRRIAFFSTPNVLKDNPKVKDVGGLDVYMKRLRSELADFMYYLAKEVDELPADKYTSPIATKERHAIIAKTMYASDKVVYCLKHGLKDMLDDLCDEHSIERVSEQTDYREDGSYILLEELEELYFELTNGNGKPTALAGSAKKLGLKMKPTTRQGHKAYLVQVGWSEHEDGQGN